MINKIFCYYLLLVNKYNEVLAINVVMVALFSIMAIVVGLIEGAEYFFNFAIILSLLYAPSYFIGNKMRTCPSCKSWKHNKVHSIKREDIKIEYYCKRCQSIWEKNNHPPNYPIVIWAGIFNYRVLFLPSHSHCSMLA